jgi:hypothetical protein
MADVNNEIKENQHWIPKFHMEEFKDSNNFIHVLDIVNRKILKPYPYRGVCYKKFFYGSEAGKFDQLSQDVEDVLQRLENNMAPRYEEFKRQVLNCGKIEDEYKYYAAAFICLSWIRTPLLREWILGISNKLAKTILSARAENEDVFFGDIKKVAPEISVEEMNECRQMLLDKKVDFKFDNAGHIRFMLSNVMNFSNLFYSKNWIIHIASGEKEFIISDTPVIEVGGRVKGRWLAKTFLERNHYFSMTPKIMIEMRDPISGKNIKRKSINDNDVFLQNNLRANHSLDYCYARRKEEFEEMIEYVKRINPV